VQLLALPADVPAPTTDVAPLTADERHALQQASQHVTLGDDAAAGLLSLRRWLASQHRPLSDRRWRQWLGLMRVAAAAEGRHQLDLIDLWLGPHVTSPVPEQQAAVREWVEVNLLGIRPWDLRGFERAVQAFEAQLNIETSLPAEASAGTDAAAGKASLARGLDTGAAAAAAGPDTPRAQRGEPLRLNSPTQETRNRRHFSRLHIDARLAELRTLQHHLQAQQMAAHEAWQALRAQLDGRLWPPGPVQQAWLQTLQHNAMALDALVQAAQALADGFAALPLDTHSQAAPAPAVVWENLTAA